MSIIKGKFFMINGKSFKARKSIFTSNASPIHISDNMTGKMEGIPSISTSCLDNPICIQRMKEGRSVCKHCFAAALMERKPSVREATKSNFDLLQTVLDKELLPTFRNVQIVRIESFGDVASVNQCINYLNIAYKNPDIRFAAWTKNLWLWNKAIETIGKPGNLSLVYSSWELNCHDTPSDPENVDHIFTVYDKQTSDFYGGNEFINCGARDCYTCQKCYHKGSNFMIREQLK